jgi:hypothetical protein
LPKITETVSIGHLEGATARLSCMLLLEGNWCSYLNQGHCLPTPCSLIGIGEIVILPLDVLKIKRQTNPEAFRGRGVFRIIADEGFGLYRGWGWTAARNAPGSFAVSLFQTFCNSKKSNNISIAFWWLGCCQRIPL